MFSSLAYTDGKKPYIKRKIALIAFLMGSVSACSNDFSRISEEEYTSAVARQRAFLGQPVSQPMPVAPSQNNGITPVVQAPIDDYSRSDIAAQAPYRPTPQNMASGAYQDANGSQPKSTAYQGHWTRIGGTTIQVEPGDTLQMLSRRYGVPEKAILDTNGYNNPSDIVAGRMVVIPTYVYGNTQNNLSASGMTVSNSTSVLPKSDRYQPSVAASRPANIPASSSTNYRSYKVVSGDTLYSIARQNGVAVSELSTANDLGHSHTIRIGQVLRIPGASPGSGQIQSTAQVKVATQNASPEPAVKPVRTVSIQAPVSSPAKPVAYTPPSSEPSPAMTQEVNQTLSFRWPVQGRVLSTFGDQLNGERNDGINLAVPVGTPVKSAEKGVVIYAGDELKSYGNLVLVRHSDNWVTAYAHNSKLLVKRGDQVTRGQDIALAGATGSVSSPQLRFEIRKGSSPVNPLNHLKGL